LGSTGLRAKEALSKDRVSADMATGNMEQAALNKSPDNDFQLEYIGEYHNTAQIDFVVHISTPTPFISIL